MLQPTLYLFNVDGTLIDRVREDRINFGLEANLVTLLIANPFNRLYLNTGLSRWKVNYSVMVPVFQSAARAGKQQHFRDQRMVAFCEKGATFLSPTSRGEYQEEAISSERFGRVRKVRAVHRHERVQLEEIARQYGGYVTHDLSKEVIATIERHRRAKISDEHWNAIRTEVADAVRKIGAPSDFEVVEEANSIDLQHRGLGFGLGAQKALEHMEAHPGGRAIVRIVAAGDTPASAEMIEPIAQWVDRGRAMGIQREAEFWYVGTLKLKAEVHNEACPVRLPASGLKFSRGMSEMVYGEARRVVDLRLGPTSGRDTSQETALSGWAPGGEQLI